MNFAIKLIFVVTLTLSVQSNPISSDSLLEKNSKSYRCGTPDAPFIGRQKRYALVSKWPKKSILWRFDESKNCRKFRSDADKIRRRISEALAVWQYHIPLTFHMKSANDIEVDIEVLFVPPIHRDIDSWEMADRVLAHAFYPSNDNGLSGDVHFNEKIDWDFDADANQEPKHGYMSFFAVALHELGHSLGLNHSSVPDSTMYEAYSDRTSSLSQDDINGIQANYGKPRNYKPTKITTTRPRVITSERPWTTEAPPRVDEKPDKCRAIYDAVMTFNTELFIFSGRFMFRPQHGSVSEIRQMWPQLPRELTHIDAAYQRKDGLIMFFVSHLIYVFKGTELSRTIKLSQIGLRNVEEVDVIFNLATNQETYIISGEKYWRFEETSYRVFPGYPKAINRFKGVYDMDTAITFDGRLYFFRGEYFYEFNTRDMAIGHKRPQLSANKFMKCHLDERTYRGSHESGKSRRKAHMNAELNSQVIVLSVSKQTIVAVVFVFLLIR